MHLLGITHADLAAETVHHLVSLRKQRISESEIVMKFNNAEDSGCMFCFECVKKYTSTIYHPKIYLGKIL